MKNQYFGDKRDFIKYSLIVDVLGHRPEMGTFVFVPMLTKDDPTNEGNVRHYECGSRDGRVFEFLQADQEKKDIRNWRTFFDGTHFPNIKYINDLDEAPFTHENRENYFQRVPLQDINNALVFIDPDIGIQPENKRTWGRIVNHPEKAEKYILKSDIKRLAKSIPDSTALMVYQHLQRNRHRHKAQAEEKLGVLSEFFGDNASSVRCSDVQYLFASKSTSVQQAIDTTLKEHASRNEMTFEDIRNH